MSNHEVERRRLVRRLYELIDEVEGRPVRRRHAYGFPFDQLEEGFQWLLTGLEVAIGYIVDAILDWLEKRGIRRRK